MKRIKDTEPLWNLATSPMPELPALDDPIWQTAKLQRLLALLRGEWRSEPDIRVEQDAAA